MSKLDTLQGKALELAGQIGDGIRHVPDHAEKWLKAGVALGAARAGGKALTRTARRNPALTATAAVAAVAAAGAGLLIYAVRRRKKANGEGATIEGKAKRVEARRAATRAPRKTATKRAPRKRAEAAADKGGDES